jgi:hypothetical protein
VIPPFAKFGLLPPGIHWTTWEEFSQHFNLNPRREVLLVGLKAALDSLTLAGCTAVYIDGSFVTRKAEPNDFDGCWSGVGVDPTKLDPALLDFTNDRRAMKEKYGGELFVAETPADLEGRTFLDFFQAEIRRETRIRKGIIGIRLGKTQHEDQK